MKHNIIIEIICFLLILLFVYAALSKLFDYDSFRQQLQRIPLLSQFSNAGWILPVAELITAVMLCVRLSRFTGLYISFFLLLAFTIYIAGMLLLAKHLPCSCGGVLRQMTWTQHLLFNIFFLLISLAGIRLEKDNNNHKRIAY